MSRSLTLRHTLNNIPNKRFSAKRSLAESIEEQHDKMLKFLMSGKIGTDRERNAVKRILSNLGDQYHDELNKPTATKLWSKLTRR